MPQMLECTRILGLACTEMLQQKNLQVLGIWGQKLPRNARLIWFVAILTTVCIGRITRLPTILAQIITYSILKTIISVR